MKSSQTGKPRVVPLSDLAPRVDVKGGSGRRVFGQDEFPQLDSDQGVVMKKVSKSSAPSKNVKKTVKDLSVSSKAGGVKGGLARQK